MSLLGFCHNSVFAVCALLAASLAAPAQLAPNPWVVNSDGRKGRSTDARINAVVSRYSADVQQISYTATDVYVRSAGIPSYAVGPFGDGNPAAPTDRAWLFRIPRNPTELSGTKTATPLGPIGVLVNGLPIYNALDAMSYNNQSIWNQNAVVNEARGFDAGLGHPAPVRGGATIDGFVEGIYHHHQLSPSLVTLLGGIAPDRHSPIIGYAFDGFPVYGPFAFANSDGSGGIRRMRSSYRLRNITVRQTLPDGSQLPASQYGPDVSQRALGTYVEDFEFVTGLGDLDAYNGRVAVTPEYPRGTFAYFATTDEQGQNVYPYLVGPRYYGVAARDNFSRAVTIPSPSGAVIAGGLVNAASFATAPVSRDSIASLFGGPFSAVIASAPATPLPTALEGFSATLVDTSGAELQCPLFFISAAQVNLHVPAAALSGAAVLRVRRIDGTPGSLNITIASTAPGLFAANSDGRGVGAIIAVRVARDNTQSLLPVFTFDAAAGRFIAAPLDLATAEDRVYFSLYGTGLRYARSVTVTVGGQAVPVISAGAQSQFVGLDQVNIGPLPRSLAGAGEVAVRLEADGTAANEVTVRIR